jgi:hypothetical protein
MNRRHREAAGAESKLEQPEYLFFVDIAFDFHIMQRRAAF